MLELGLGWRERDGQLSEHLGMGVQRVACRAPCRVIHRRPALGHDALLRHGNPNRPAGFLIAELMTDRFTIAAVGCQCKAVPASRARPCCGRTRARAQPCCDRTLVSSFATYQRTPETGVLVIRHFPE